MTDRSDIKKIDALPYRCSLNIKAIYRTLKTAEKRAIDYIISNPEKIKDISIDGLAAEAGCSKSTIVRISKRLGYSGFSSLKSDFAKSMKNPKEDFMEYEGISRTDSPFKVMEKVFDSSIRSVKDTLRIIDKGEFLKALEAILEADKILFCGIGDAYLVALEAYQRFTRLGVDCNAESDPDIQLLKSSQLKKGDIFFAISYSGRSIPVIDCLKVAKRTQATSIALTNYPVSPIAKKSDILLQTAVFTKYPTGEVMSKRLTELLVIESLYTNYIIRKTKEIKKEIETSHRILDINKA